MIIRVQGRDRTMRIEVSGATTAEEIKQKIDKRTGSQCSALLRNGEELRGSVEENSLENGEMLTAEYEVVRPDSSAPEEGAAKEASPKNTACQHGPSGMCANCMAEDSWVSTQFKERRSISQGAYEDYLRSKEKILRVETHLPDPCRSHKAEHRCNNCMPKEIFLARQPFRPVDHVEVHDKAIFEQILMEQREKGAQSVHFLVGRYSEYTEVPGGRRAEVFGRVTPQQRSLANGFIVDPSDRILNRSDSSLNRVLALLKMEIVGMVYTRISEDPVPFVSAFEVDFMAKMQNVFSEWEGGERKGSKFVSLVLAGTKTSSEIIEFMATHLGMELAMDGILQASSNPAEMAVRSIDVVWRDKEGSHTGNRMPVEYLVVRPTHGLTQNRKIFSIDTEREQFRRGTGLSKLKKHFQKKLTENSVCKLSLGAVSDLNVLLELEDLGLLQDELVECVVQQDGEKFNDCVLNNKFKELVDIAKDCKMCAEWDCNVCTLRNAPTAAICNACGFEKGSY
ncbi:nuclear protein localization protein 4 [Nematocida major]|uniref:nuclear protein localization protein 4 n=1 Tax=Nematocida major TaxID=1912982 RepID=UPI002008BDAD|nr:nuclear protein localization protein 4 [Nematocida major]KAH9386318.1 nuclear protein localization protein 4 [Nematocida major]